MNTAIRKSILHVDDDPAVLRLVSKKLQGMDFNVISVQDPLQAIESLKRHQCPVVISDIDMPGLNGLDLLRQIKHDDAGTQVIMLSGLVSMSTIIQSMRLGADACVFKPIQDFAELETAIHQAFDKIEYWWNALRTLKERKDATTLVANAANE